jgi:hypothetical protein
MGVNALFGPCQLGLWWQGHRNFSSDPRPKTVKAGDRPKLLKKLLALNMLEEAGYWR